MKSSSRNARDGEFLWLVSLSDLMILLFVFFIVLFSFSYQKMSSRDFEKISGKFSGEERNTLDQIQAQLMDWVQQQNLLPEVKIEQKEDSLIVQIKEGLLFDSASSNLKLDSQAWLQAVGQILDKVPKPYRIGIEGHTDDVPASGALGDNWQLSSLRAVAVLRALRLGGDLASRAVVLGYGDSKPLAPNKNPDGSTNPENRKKNRRVSLSIF